MSTSPYTLYLVTDRSFSQSTEQFEQIIKEAIQGGVTIVQLREKTASTSEFIELAKNIKKITKEYGIPLIINDRVDVALVVDADGLHIGPEDMTIKQARTLLGPNKIIGYTVSSAETARDAFREGANYLGTEAIFETPTKKYSVGPLGLSVLKEIVEAVPIPVVAIGGINSINATEVVSKTNCAGIACVSAIMAAKNPKEAAEHLVSCINKNNLNVEKITDKKIKEQILFAFSKIKASKPLLVHITNYVVMNITANATLHIGGLPVMIMAPEEMQEMVSKANALVLNAGTPTKELRESMVLAGKKANELKIPIVLDPVGAGATAFRTEYNSFLLKNLKISILRGNAGEMGALSGSTESQMRGVECVQALTNPEAVAEKLAYQYETTVAISGMRDIVSDGNRIFGVDNGSPWLQQITGSGCVATTIISAFAAVENDPVVAALGGYALLGVVAEFAAKSSRVEGPASFTVALLDELKNLTEGEFAREMKIVQLK